jgi:hypothetical protein
VELTALAPDYARFHGLALASRDVDPVYPVLRALADALALTPEDTTRLVMHHVAFYHLGSALAYYAGERGKLPTGVERRGHRDPKQLMRHLAALRAVEREPGGYMGYLAAGLPADPWAAWRALVGRLLAVHGNGRWAAYKSAEMLWKVCGYPVAAPDMGHAYSSGPRKGLALLTAVPEGNGAAAVAELDRVSGELCGWLVGQGYLAPVEEVETTLCDFHSLCKGNYYVGHDIDQMLRQLLDVQSPLTKQALAARGAALPWWYLGEVRGWSGVDRDRRRWYQRTGEIVIRGAYV